MKMITISVDSNPDFDDCFEAAVDAYVKDHPDAAGWDLSPRWEDDNNRESILLTVPIFDVTP